MGAASTHAQVGGVVLGRYRIVAPLARGGMGIVYLGRLEGAAGFAKPVVIKTVIPEGNDSKGAVQLFVREARILSNLEHPSIVGVLDFGEAGADYVMVLEYVHGFHLGAWSRFVHATRGHMPIAHAVEAMLPVLDALDFAHSLKRPDGAPLGIVHRDISPANILIDNQGHVKLHDFGIARMADDEFKTQDGTFRGTLSYCAPETVQGVAASPRSDLYGCGVVIYQLISGINPFKGQQPSETLHRVLKHVPPGLGSAREEVSERLERVVARAMAKDPAERFESAAEFAAELRAARSWSEATANQDLAHTIQTDFNSEEMPELLELEPLTSRDKAWRAAVGERTRLSSSPPRRLASASDSMSRVALESAPDASLKTINAIPSDALLELARSGRSNSEPRAEEEPTQSPKQLRAARAEQARQARSSRRTLLALVGAAVVVLAGGAVGFAMLGGPREPAATRFLLIEKQPAVSSPSAASSAGSQETPLPSPRLSDAKPSAPTPTGSSKAPSAPAGPSSGAASSLSAAFQRQQGSITACFRNTAGDFSGQPQLIVHFKIDGSGNVQSAELSPSSISSSALGACILGVARSTHFPASGATVNFAIPITAVRR